MLRPKTPFTDSLVVPLRTELEEDSRYDYWLKLADQALTRAREEQERIKQQIQPQIEHYRQIQAARVRAAKPYNVRR